MDVAAEFRVSGALGLPDPQIGDRGRAN